MKDAAPQTIYLKSYEAPNFYITHTYLEFDLDETKTLVKSRLSIKRNIESAKEDSTLTLKGIDLELKTILVDGEVLNVEQYSLSDDTLKIFKTSAEFLLEIENHINPSSNKALEGLYKSGEIFCTQNEPEGFRRITFFSDRPDVMSIYTTKIIADKKKYPVLLSNGNPIDSGDLSEGKHFVTWKDPYPKPSYLYALVAGNLALVQDSYTTMSGRKIDLRIYVDKGNESKCGHAMTSLKKSMEWDEKRFSLEYDLDIYMIVAVDAFNMGAMENKGLNIFNSSCVLADQATATDDNFYHVEAVIGHEYFHNWTGNRVTCRDWFQLTLKEGLTVFRDQEFSSDLNSRIVARINNIRCLRLKQFAEDSGPTSHPIKPSSFIEINNFYTMTIYEKGSEVIRMIHTLLTEEGFMKGMKKYFELFDGQAVTTEDFLHAMSVSNNNFDFSLFENWYSTNGTPFVSVNKSYDKEKEEFTLEINQEGNNIFMIPLGIGLIDKNGQDLPLKLKDNSKQTMLDRGILLLTKKKESFTFSKIKENPLPSLNRNFSAPINLEMNYTNEELSFLMSNDSDEFNRYDACQILANNVITSLMNQIEKNEELSISSYYVKSFGKILDDELMSDAFKSLMLDIPSEGALHLKQSIINYKDTHIAREFLVKSLADTYKDKLLSLYSKKNQVEEFNITPESMGKRSLKGKLLCFLVRLKIKETEELCRLQFLNATNMTDEILSLSYLVNYSPRYKDEALLSFYNKWNKETLVMQKWLAVQANSPGDETYQNVLDLEHEKIYDKTVPNLVRHLIGVFSTNAIQFNHESGRGYKLIADKIIELDAFNPQVAARISSSYNDFKKLPKNLHALMKNELERILKTENLSNNVFEIISKTLKDG